jgi:hypothetical protein
LLQRKSSFWEFESDIGELVLKRNIDCVRDLLLCVEANTDLRHVCGFVYYDYAAVQEQIGEELIEPKPYQVELEKTYDNDDIIYTIKYCIEANLIKSNSVTLQYFTIIQDLTPAGHDFLANIRSKDNWDKVKKAAAKIGSTSMEVLIDIAKCVVMDAAKRTLGIE